MFLCLYINIIFCLCNRVQIRLQVLQHSPIVITMHNQVEQMNLICTVQPSLSNGNMCIKCACIKLKASCGSSGKLQAWHGFLTVDLMITILLMSRIEANVKFMISS